MLLIELFIKENDIGVEKLDEVIEKLEMVRIWYKFEWRRNLRRKDGGNY